MPVFPNNDLLPNVYVPVGITLYAEHATTSFSSPDIGPLQSDPMGRM